jgi:hypothetical protein
LVFFSPVLEVYQYSLNDRQHEFDQPHEGLQQELNSDIWHLLGPGFGVKLTLLVLFPLFLDVASWFGWQLLVRIDHDRRLDFDIRFFGSLIFRFWSCRLLYGQDGFRLGRFRLTLYELTFRFLNGW